MNINKNLFVGIITLGLLMIAGLAIFWMPSLFVDEYGYVYVNYSDQSLSVTSRPDTIFEKGVSRWTDISATFKNTSQGECAVSLQSSTIQETFKLAPGLENGVIIPKKEDIVISFCGAQRTIRVN
ncbi:MAG: hypothetical protein WCT27_02660 [Patescibacteria group bacterium]